MRILYYHQEHQTPMYLWQRVHFIDELARHGIEIDLINPLRYDTLELANQAVLETLRTTPYDLFMTPHNEELLYIDTIQSIKKVGIPTLLICFDNLLVPLTHRNVAKYFDLVWLTASENREMFTKWGAKSIMLPYGANPYTFTYQAQPEVLRAAFVGSPYGSRVNMINALLTMDVPVSLYANIHATNAGNGKANDTHSVPRQIDYLSTTLDYLTYPIGRKLLWAAAIQRLSPAARLMVGHPLLECHAPVPQQEMESFYASYGLSLSSTTARNTGILSTPVYVINLRAFEIPMCGGIQFCHYNPELANYFEENREILFFRSDDEMAEKARFYLSEDRTSARQTIRLAARRRAESEHTWYHRFGKAFDALGIPYP